MKPDLSANPFFLNEEQKSWVFRTLRSLSEEDKLRQLFCLITYNDDEDYCRYIGEQIRPGGFMSRVMTGEQCLSAVRKMQKYSRIPMLVAANLESGGNGVASDGTFFARPMGVAATGDTEQARRLGEIAGTEGSAVGVNWSFAPIADLDRNWRNPITNIRTFGSDADRVREMCVAYATEVQRHGMAACFKHFPGDGQDERDQHVAPSVNDLSCAEWDRTYGAVYRAGIAAGVMSVMIGHILFPAYTRRFRPGISDCEILPASVNSAVVSDLLRGQLGFNGLIVTDSSVMAGVSALLPRRRAVPLSIAAGCDMLLFTKDLEEDLGYMREGYRNGTLSPERLDEAVTRILALKAALRLPEKKESGTLIPRDTSALGQNKFAEWSRECAEKALTLVKEEPGVLPLTPAKYPRVLFFPLENRKDGATIFGQEGAENTAFCKALRDAGFDVTVFQPKAGFEGMMSPIRETEEHYDLILYSANLQTRSNQTVVRPEWAQPMGADVPVFCHTIPTVFVSFANPYHLADVPQIRTFINCYSGSDTVLSVLMEKLTGKSAFCGVPPSDPFCGKWEARLPYLGMKGDVLRVGKP